MKGHKDSDEPTFRGHCTKFVEMTEAFYSNQNIM